jgi:hypothetical protein
MDEAIKNMANSEDESTQATASSGALVALDTAGLNQESLSLINQLIAESDLEKTKDLTHLFNINQNKKTMIRIDKLSGLQDNLVDQFAKRIAERPNEISNKELMDGIKIVQDIIERGQKQVEGVNQAPLIQFNQQNNSVNLGEESGSALSRESRDKVKNAVLALLNGLNKTPTTVEDFDTQPIVVDVAENVEVGEDEDD